MSCARIIQAALFILITPLRADEGVAFFEKKVRPLLIERCFECHSAEKKIKGGLRLDSRDGWAKGGDAGPAIVPGKPEESPLIEAIRYHNLDLQMPPKGAFSREEVAIFEQWVQMGAPDPRLDGLVVEKQTGLSLEEGRKFWSYSPITSPKVPVVADSTWAASEVDCFVLAKMESAQVKPAPPAQPGALVRRLYFTLVGLPPSEKQMDEFTAAASTDMDAATEKLVDALLASNHFGETWGRHWLDLARFSESSGGGRTLLFKDAWRYRDYVIEAFNADMPFDQFIREQVAGDLLPASTRVDRRRQLIATTFLALGPTNYEEQDKQQLRFDVIDEQIDTLGRALLGQTIGCARCHDHKFDPIPQADYYALAGIFASTRTLMNYTDNVARWISKGLPEDEPLEANLLIHEAEVARLNDRLAKAKTALESLAKKPTQESKRVSDELTPKAQTVTGTAGKEDAAAPARQQVKSLELELKQLKSGGPQRRTTMVVHDDEKPGDTWLRVRGLEKQRGQSVRRGFPGVLTSDVQELPPAQSGRRELADWIASAENPLAARVLANRIWTWLFGQGLVRTVDNFGTTGEPPTHPELLDFLAVGLIQHNWSVKRLVREIVLSRTWQQSVESPSADDPENRLLSHASRRRLGAEQIRDAMLSVSGNLDPGYLGPNIAGAGDIDPNNFSAQDIEYGYHFADTKRSIYTPAFRNNRLELFEVFDFGDINQSVGLRTVSTVAPQALYFLNHPFVASQSKLAAKALHAAQGSIEERLNMAFRRTLGRPPLAAEKDTSLSFLQGASDALEAWAALQQSLFASIDFRYLP